MSGANAIDVFISYKKEDRAYAERIAQKLGDEGLSVWWDNDITPRLAWDAMIEEKLAAATSVLVLWSPRSVISDWVRTEAHYGHDRGTLVPVKIEPCALPLAFMLSQTVDLSGWNGDRDYIQWRRLMGWITDLTEARGQDGKALPAANGTHSRFRQVVGQLPSGEQIVDGAFVNTATPSGTAFRDSEETPVMRILPAGEFVVGTPPSDPDRTSVEGPQKRIVISRPLAIGVFPVSRREYEQFAGAAAPSSTGKAPLPRTGLAALFGRPATPTQVHPMNLPLAPMVSVSFNEAVKFAEWVSVTAGQTYRLPSETEWEYACRAGSSSRYAWGDAIEPSHAAFRYTTSPAPTGPVLVGSFPANKLGLFDMHGNVREWTQDLWRESYDFTPGDGSPALEGHASMRVVRGGSWRDPPSALRSSARARATETIRADSIGLRLVRTLN